MITVKEAKKRIGIPTRTRKQWYGFAYDRKDTQEYCVYLLGISHYWLAPITRDGGLWYLGNLKTESHKGILIKRDLINNYQLERRD